MNQRRDFIISLIKENILIHDVSEGQEVYRLNSPCEIHLTDSVVEELNKAYLSHLEIGGFLLAKPSQNNGKIYINIEKVAFISNVSDTPSESYINSRNETETILDEIKNQKVLPMWFHTHPTKHNDEPAYEILNYVRTSNTSEPDQYASTYPIIIEKFKLLMPETLITRRNNEITGQALFVGFYNGGIAPLDFKTYRIQQVEKWLGEVASSLGEWSRKDKWNMAWIWIAIGIFVYITIRYPKAIINFAIIAKELHPIFINDAHYCEKPQYFTQIASGKAVIEIP